MYQKNLENWKIMLYFATETKNKQDMKRIFRTIIEHPIRVLVTIGLLALAIHWGFFGFMLLSVPMFALWENLLP